MNIQNYKTISFVGLVLTLIHSQISVERQFSVNNQVLDNNMQMMSIMVQTQLINHMKVNQLTPHSIDISKDLLLSVKGPSTRYRIYLEEETKKKGDSEAENHTAIISQACDLVQLFVEVTFCALVGVHLHTYIALYGYFSLCKNSDPTMKAAGSEVLL